MPGEIIPESRATSLGITSHAFRCNIYAITAAHHWFGGIMDHPVLSERDWLPGPRIPWRAITAPRETRRSSRSALTREIYELLADSGACASPRLPPLRSYKYRS